MSKTLDNALAFPALSAGTAGQVLALNSGGTGYEFQEGATQEISPPTDWYDIGTRTVLFEEPHGIQFDMDQLMASGAEGTVGPTGSGAPYETAALDAIPAHAKGLILYVNSGGQSAAAGAATLSVGFSRVGEVPTSVQMYRFDAEGAGEDFNVQSGQYTVPVNPAFPQRFNAVWSGVNLTLDIVRVSVAGYTY